MNGGEIALGLISNNASVAREPWPLGVYVDWIAELFGMNLNTQEGFGAFRDFIHSLGDRSVASELIADPNLAFVLGDIIDHRELLLPY